MKTKLVSTVLFLMAVTSACTSKSADPSDTSSAAATTATTTANPITTPTTTPTTTTPTSGVTGVTVVASGTSSTLTTATGLRDISGASIVAGETLFLRNKATQECMDLQDGNTADGGVIQTYSCIANNPNQIWMLTPNADGSYLIQSTVDGMCLDLTLTGIPNEQNPFQTWDCTGGSNQSYYIQTSASGGYQIVPVASPFQCVTGNDVMDAETCSGASNQSFDLIASTNQDPADAVEVTSTSVTTTCTTANGPGMAPALSDSKYTSYLLATPILVTSNDQCDQYCDAHNATTCLMSYNASAANYYCSPLSSSGVMSGNSTDFAVSCNQQ